MNKLFLVFFRFVHMAVLAQHPYHLGVKAGYYYGNQFYGNALIEGVYVHTTQAGLDGFKIEVFGDYALSKRFAASLELGYSWNVGRTGPMVSATNVLMTRDSLDWLVTTGPSFNTLELHGQLQFKPHRFLALYGGSGVWRLFSEEDYQYVFWDENDYTDPNIKAQVRRENFRNGILKGVDDSLMDWAFMARFGMRFEFFRFIIDANYAYTLRPMSTEIYFEEKRYPFVR